MIAILAELTTDTVWTELIASLITLVGIGLYTKGRKWYRDRKIRKQFPIEGDYFTYFEESYTEPVSGGDAGPPVTKTRERKATLKIKQRGVELTGTTTLVKGDRGYGTDRPQHWVLTGTVHPHGLISGTYGALEPQNPSKGSFFMEADPDSEWDYKGSWAGFDPFLGTVNHGIYKWRRHVRVKARLLSRRDQDLHAEIVAIISDALGHRFISQEQVKEMLTNKNGKRLVGAFVDGKLVGVRTIALLDDSAKLDFQKEVLKSGSKIDLQGHKVGILAACSVHRDYQRKGVGAELLQVGLAELRKLGCTLCVTISWESGKKNASAPLLESAGFVKVGVVKEYWREASEKDGYECPTCGNPPCKCSAQFFKLRL